MGFVRLAGAAAAALVATVGSAVGFSLLEEVTVIDPNLAAELVWENPDAKTYCQNMPENLDRLACRVLDPEEFWFGIDAEGNRYGVIVGTEMGSTYFDIYRRPVGTSFNHHIVRITKRVELVVGQPVKLFPVGRWEVDLTNGALLVGLKGECFDADCMTDGDTTEHLGLIKITGLPSLFDVVSTYQPPAAMSFRIPAVPQGLEVGDRYDVYAGDIQTLPDLTQAQPVACDVAVGKSVGDLVTVIDPLPAPPAGTSRYYLTSVTRAGEKRAGRRRQGGALSGRVSVGLPLCP